MLGYLLRKKHLPVGPRVLHFGIHFSQIKHLAHPFSVAFPDGRCGVLYMSKHSAVWPTVFRITVSRPSALYCRRVTPRPKLLFNRLLHMNIGLHDFPFQCPFFGSGCSYRHCHALGTSVEFCRLCGVSARSSRGIRLGLQYSIIVSSLLGSFTFVHTTVYGH